MKNQTVQLSFFSPTGTTRSIIQAIGHGTGRKAEPHLDLTLIAAEPAAPFTSDDLLVIGMPVYAGRLPNLAVERFKTLQGNSTPTVIVAVYGNREYDDALVELCDLCKEQGFQVIAAAAFIGEHSFTSKEFPIASDRPDENDLQQAGQLGEQVQNLLNETQSISNLTPPSPPGNRPYKPNMQPSGHACETDPLTCTQCGLCVEHCPTQAIQMIDGIPVTDPENCIWCMACVRICPTGARTITQPKVHKLAERLHNTCQTRKEPEWFLANA